MRTRALLELIFLRQLVSLFWVLPPSVLIVVVYRDQAFSPPLPAGEEVLV